MTAISARTIRTQSTAQALVASRVNNRTARLFAATVLFVALALLAGQARATTFGFEAVEGLFPTSAISLEVTQSGADQVTFTLLNNGTGDTGSITAIYFDWGTLSALFSDPNSIDDSLAGVDYTDKDGNWYAATPANMPGAAGMANPFFADFGIRPESKGGTSKNGVGGGEYVSITFALGGIDYAGLIAAMDSDDVRIGLHLQSLPDGSSATGVSTSATPIPGAVWLLGSGLFGLIGLRERIRTR